MAVKNIAVTDTLETFRTQFNDLAANDFGDAAALSAAGISATSVVGASIAAALDTTTLLTMTGLSRSTRYSRNDENVLSPCDGISIVY